MVLPSSGQIGMLDLKNEFFDSDPVSLNEFYRGGNYVSGGVGDLVINQNIPTSGQISLDDFYGGQAYFTYTISSNVADLDLVPVLRAAGWNDDRIPVYVRVDPGVYVYSTVLQEPAMNIRVTGLYSLNITIENRGFILGRGGENAGGGSLSMYRGSRAIDVTSSFAQINLTLNNYGTIAGGGGAGGRSTLSLFNGQKLIIGAGGGGAGGGAGDGIWELIYRDANGNQIFPPQSFQRGIGGAGGGPGQAGSNGTGTNVVVNNQGGGAGGGGGGTLFDGFYVAGGGGGRITPGVGGNGLFADGGSGGDPGQDGRTGAIGTANNQYAGGGGGWGARGGNSYYGGGDVDGAVRNNTGGTTTISFGGLNAFIYGAIQTS